MRKVRKFKTFAKLCIFSPAILAENIKKYSRNEKKMLRPVSKNCQLAVKDKLLVDSSKINGISVFDAIKWLWFVTL
jgi:hypothetical protein